MAHYIFYHGPVTQPGVRNLETFVSQAVDKTDQEIVVCLCSGGGDVTAGIGAYNFLRMQPVPVTTYAFGVCGSVAATMFLAGRRRVSAPACMFTLHAASYDEGPRKGQISENTRLTSLPFRTALGWPEERLQQYFGTTEEHFIPAEQAKDFGIVTEILDIQMGTEDEAVHVHIP